LSRLRDDQLAVLRGIVGPGHVLTESADLSCYACDAGCRAVIPAAVVLPATTEEVVLVMALAGRDTLPVTPRGAGSGMAGGALAAHGGIILSLARMRRIIEIDTVNLLAVVEPGVVTAELQDALRSHRLMYAPDPASARFSTLGGNAATCAGGPSAIKYGVTKDWVIGLEAVLPGGEVLRTGQRTEKGVTGYDLTRLIVGSEGTLAVITRLILRLLPLPPERTTLLLLCEDIHGATALVARILASGFKPCTLEFMDQTALDLVRPHLAEPLPDETRALLLVEFDGEGDAPQRAVDRLEALCAEEQGIRLRRARDRREAEQLWSARRRISPATFLLRPNKISEDVVVPRSRIPELVDWCRELGACAGLTVLCFGHAGDGNIHVNIMYDQQLETELRSAARARELLLARVIELGGVLSGEHGIGLGKKAFVPLELDPVSLRIMRAIKAVFDPANIMNPGKIFPD